MKALFLSFLTLTNQASAEVEKAPYNGYFDRQCTSGYLQGEEISSAQRTVIRQLMGNHDHRVWHFLWHSTRESWPDLTAEEKAFLRKLGWEPPRSLPESESPEELAAKLPSAGEDFLYMHHEMIKELFAELGKRGIPCPRPWVQLPRKDDPVWPLDPGNRNMAQDEDFEYLKQWRLLFTDPKYLQKHELGYVGLLMERTLHSGMHYRWAAGSAGAFERCNDPEAALDFLLGDGHGCDAPENDWLIPSYSSHVNPAFWKLHGLIENVLLDWLRANQAKNGGCGTPDCYAWKGKWMGVPPGTYPRQGETSAQARSRVQGHRGHAHGHAAGDFARHLKKVVDEHVKGPPPAGPGLRARAAPPAGEEQRRRQVKGMFAKLQKRSFLGTRGTRAFKLAPPPKAR